MVEWIPDYLFKKKKGDKGVWGDERDKFCRFLYYQGKGKEKRPKGGGFHHRPRGGER